MQENKDQIEACEDKEVNDILSSIFIINYKSNQILPRIKKNHDIQKIFCFLYSNNKLKKLKFYLIEILFQLFTENTLLIPYFEWYDSNYSLYSLGIFYYLEIATSPEEDEVIFSFLTLIRKNISITKVVLEEIFQRLAQYFNNRAKIQLTSQLLIKYLKLLQLFYNERDEVSNIEEQTNKQKIINNYFYFNGIESQFQIELNQQRKNKFIDFPNLEVGFSIVFWIKMDNNIIEEHFAQERGDITFVKIKLFKSSYITLSMIKKKTFTFSLLNNPTPVLINVAGHLKFNQWNSFYLIIQNQQIFKNNGYFVLFINGKKTYREPLPGILTHKIEKITFMENYIGKMSSLMIFTCGVELKKSFFPKYQYGFYKDRWLYQMVKEQNKEYLDNAVGVYNLKNYSFYNDNNSINNFAFDFNIDKLQSENNVIIFAPFSYDNKTHCADDICGNFHVKMNKSDGVNMHKSNGKNIQILKGINNILPIAELMLMSLSKKSDSEFSMISSDLLSKETFCEYLTLLKLIILYSPKNLEHANNCHFFSSLGLFLEKFPKEVYTEKILELLYQIGLFVFGQESEKNQKRNFNHTIFLNEKIISKFSNELQEKLWGKVLLFASMDSMQTRNFLSMSKLCLLLRYSDRGRYSEFCCKEHAELFAAKKLKENELGMKVMNPQMKEKIAPLIKTIEEIIKTQNESNDEIFKLLSLDLSPCLQKSIISLYINYFNNANIKKEDKKKTLSAFVQSNCLDIALYTLSLSLLDVRALIIELIGIFMNHYSAFLSSQIEKLNEGIRKENEKKEGNNKIMEINEKDMLIFISDNLLPTKLLIEVDESEIKILDSRDDVLIGKSLRLDLVNLRNSIEKIRYDKRAKTFIKKKIIPLMQIINQDIYHNQIEEMWQALKKLISMHKINPDKEKKRAQKKKESMTKKVIYKNTNTFDMISKFVSESSTKFVCQYLGKILGMGNHSNNNKEIYEKESFYNWVIESIFFFFDDENTIKEDKNQVKIIKNQLLHLINILFSHEIKSSKYMSRIKYILEYGFYLKQQVRINNINKNDCKNVNELIQKKYLVINQIIRLILKELLSSEQYINFKSKVCFEFMFIFQNSELLTNDNKSKSNEFECVINKIQNGNIDELVKSSLYDFNQNSLHDNFNDSMSSSSQIISIEPTSTLTSIWHDYFFFEKIIDTYSHIWDIDKLCQLVSIDMQNSNLTALAPKLIMEYGFNKKNKNVTLEIIKKLLITQKSTTIKPKKKDKFLQSISLLNILSVFFVIAIVLTKDKTEKDYWENQFIHFIVFCTLSSINLLPNEKDYLNYQEQIQIVLVFGLHFFQKTNDNLYTFIIDKFIKTIFIEMIIKKKEKKSSLNIFTTKIDLSKCALIKAFNVTYNEEVISKTEEENANNKRGSSIIEIANKGILKFEDYEKQNEDIIKLIELKVNWNEIINSLFNTETFSYIYNRIYVEEIESSNFIPYYNNNNNTNYNNDNRENDFIKIAKKEKNRIESSIEKIVPFFENKIKLYSNGSYREEKIRKNHYKGVKKILFSWKGLWSDRYLFYEHPEFLKLRLKNHYTSEMLRPLLVPILDIDYYLPSFTKFDPSNLFNQGDFKYKINLDIDEILSINKDDDIKEKNNNNIFNWSNKNDLPKNNYGFNHMESLYKLTYPSLWKKCKKEFLKSLDWNIASPEINDFYPIYAGNEISHNYIYECCLVKQSRHIKGVLKLEEHYIKFTVLDNSLNNSNNESQSQSQIQYDEDEQTQDYIPHRDSINFDTDRGTCFGSYLKWSKKDKDKFELKINYSKIQYIFKRRTFYQLNSMEIFTDTNKSYFFTFKKCETFSSFIDIIIKKNFYNKKNISIQDETIGYIKTPKKDKNDFVPQELEERWMKFQISTIEYLMWLNILANRSYNDLSQYPVFPWLFADYTSPSKSVSSQFFRNLSLPMGMMNFTKKSSERKELYLDQYETMKADYDMKERETRYQIETIEINPLEINQTPYFYGSHYSNPTYISHFLMRLFPYSCVMIEIQGNRFDDPDRLFISLSETFDSCITQKGDLRELIPEFFYLPEMFHNLNNMKLIQSKISEEEKKINYPYIDNVIIPKWCGNNSCRFICEMREQLENNSKENIGDWINLIFGCWQMGEKAIEHHNLFMTNTYEKSVDISKVDDKDSRDALLRLVEMGMTPKQILFKEAGKRVYKEPSNNSIQKSQGPQLSEVSMLACSKIKLEKYENLNQLSQFLPLNSQIVSISKVNSASLSKTNTITFNRAQILSSSKSNEKIDICLVKFIDNERLLLIGENDKFFLITFTQGEQEIKVLNEGKITNIYNTSNEFMLSYKMRYLNNPPIAISSNNQIFYRGGYWDGRLEKIFINYDDKLKCKVEYYYEPERIPITSLAINKDTTLLAGGTQNGIVNIYIINDSIPKLSKRLCDHDDEVISISINDTLNMIGTSSLDGYIFIYTTPLLELVRSMRIANSYAKNIFLSSSPIPSFVLFTQERNFVSYSINGMKIEEEKEEDNTNEIKCYKMFKNFNFGDFIAYGTNDGMLKIRKFPTMKMVSKVNISTSPLKTLELTKDNKHCFIWSEGFINIIKEPVLIKEKEQELFMIR